MAGVPIILGRGERLWDGLEGIEQGYDVESIVTPSGVSHMMFSRKTGCDHVADTYRDSFLHRNAVKVQLPALAAALERDLA